MTALRNRKHWQPDPKDLADHREWKKHREATIDSERSLDAVPIEIQPTDDAPVSALEPFGVDAEMLGILYTRLPTVGDARRAISHPEDGIKYFGDVGRQQVTQALVAADRWLAENPPIAS